jgi:hypothetical protein
VLRYDSWTEDYVATGDNWRQFVDEGYPALTRQGRRPAEISDHCSRDDRIAILGLLFGRLARDTCSIFDWCIEVAFFLGGSEFPFFK